MPVRKSAELFGDNAANGPRVPIETTPANNQLGAKNRGIAYKEPLTSRSVNRICYALALNDDDLEARLAVFEVGGLDTVYRQGLAGVAGAGRVVNIDGGAIEARHNIASTYAGDRANASIRARAEGATVDGAGGFDYVARAGGTADPSPGRGGWGFLDRRAVVFNGPRTRLAFTQNGVLNVNGASKTSISVSGADYFSASGQTDLLVGVDLVEIFDGVHAGLYVVTDASVAQRAVLQRFDGVAPNFGPNVAVTFRVYRPVFTTGGGKIGAAPTFGSRFVAMPGDTDHAPAIQLLQPSTSAYLVAGINKSGGRVFSVNGAGNVEAADIYGSQLRTPGATIAANGAISGLSFNVGSGEVTNNLRVGSLTVTSGSVSVSQSSADKYTANEFQGGVFKGASAAITGPLSAYNISVLNYGNLTLDGGNLTLSTALPNGGRITGRSLAVTEYVNGASASFSGAVSAGGLTAGSATLNGAVRIAATDLEIGTLAADPSYPGYVRVGAGVRVDNIVSAKQFSLSPNDVFSAHRIPMSAWRATGKWREGLTSNFHAFYLQGDGTSLASSTLVVPLSGFIQYNARITKIAIQYAINNSNGFVPITARCVAHRNQTTGEGIDAWGTTGNIYDHAATPPLSLVGNPDGTVTERSWSIAWTSSATSLPLRRSDPYVELWIQADNSLIGAGYGFYVFAVVVDWTRAGF